MRTTSSNRPGSAAPVTDAAPLAAASDIAPGRSDGRKSSLPAERLERVARTIRTPAAAASELGSACWSGQPVDAKCRAARTEMPSATSVTTTLRTRRPRVVRERPERLIDRIEQRPLRTRDPNARSEASAAGCSEVIGRGPGSVLRMRMRGIEPPRGRPHTDLNRARLPIPPHPRGCSSIIASCAPGANGEVLRHG